MRSKIKCIHYTLVLRLRPVRGQYDGVQTRPGQLQHDSRRKLNRDIRASISITGPTPMKKTDHSDAVSPPAIARQSLHDAITSHLRDMIIEGELEPGERIYEGPLCERLGVSRTPLREALRYLASEGLVDLTPQRGASVRKFSAKDIEDMLVLIRSLEELAGRLACEKGSDEEIVEVRRLHDRMLEEYRAGNRLDYYKTNQHIHSAIVALSHNESLIQVHASLQSKLKRVRFIGHEGQEKWAAAVAEHISMIGALERRDATALVSALSEHLGHAWDRVRDVVC